MLNATTIGGKKGDRWRDDIWTMKYLSGFKWEMLGEQVGKLTIPAVLPRVNVANLRFPSMVLYSIRKASTLRSSSTRTLEITR